MNEKKASFRCGFGKADITPPLGCYIVGYYKPRFAKGVIDPLFARAALFELNGQMGMTMTLDLCLIPNPLCTDIRNAIAEKTGLDPNAILISLSHTHTGPLTNKDFASDNQPLPEYLTLLKERAVDAAVEALADLKPAKMFYAKTEAKGISFIRRFRMKDGSVKTNPSALDPMIDHALGEPNEDLRLLKITREGAEDIIIVNFGTHADTVGGEYISADYPGYVCSILEGAIPNSRSMFILGPQGDVNHANRFAENSGLVGPGKSATDPMERISHARFMARVIAGQILSVYDRAEEVASGDISFGVEDIALPHNKDCARYDLAVKVQAEYEINYNQNKSTFSNAVEASGMTVPEARRIIRMQNAPDFYNTAVFAIKLGDFVFAGLPGEPFTEIGRKIYDASPFPNMILSCQTNTSCGYVPSGSAYDEGGYEALTSSYKKGADTVMIDGMIRLLEKLK